MTEHAGHVRRREEDALAPFGARVTRAPVTRAEICAMARRAPLDAPAAAH